jgi:AcrR family transcriptional regulator
MVCGTSRDVVAIIIEAAIAEAAELGLAQLTQRGIADRALVSPGLVAYHLGRMDEARDLVATEVCKRGEPLHLLAELIVTKHPAVTAQRVPLARQRAALLAMVRRCC